MVEQGKKKTIASAFDWPGWDRPGKTEEDALAVLDTYRPRYATIAKLAGLSRDFDAAGTMQVIERVKGTGMTDYYGLSFRSATSEHDPMSKADCERKIALLQACWAYFDAIARRVSAELRKGPRGGGRERDEIVRHVNAAEMGDFARKVGVVTSPDTYRNPAALRAHRNAF